MAQLVARLHGMQKVRGSSPLGSTALFLRCCQIYGRVHLKKSKLVHTSLTDQGPYFVSLGTGPIGKGYTAAFALPSPEFDSR